MVARDPARPEHGLGDSCCRRTAASARATAEASGYGEHLVRAVAPGGRSRTPPTVSGPRQSAARSRRCVALSRTASGTRPGAWCPAHVEVGRRRAPAPGTGGNRRRHHRRGYGGYSAPHSLQRPVGVADHAAVGRRDHRHHGQLELRAAVRGRSRPSGGWWLSANTMSASMPARRWRRPRRRSLAHAAELEPHARRVCSPPPSRTVPTADAEGAVQLVGRDRRQEQLGDDVLVALAGVDPQVGAVLVAAPRRQRVIVPEICDPSGHFASSQVAPTPMSISSGGSSG